MKKAKIITKDYNKEKAEQLAKELDVSLLIAKLLLTRGIDDPERASGFLNPNLTELHDPFLLTDMDKAVEIILQAIEQEEVICIYGDYDVDGITATSLLYLFLRDLGAKIQYYIPDRMKDGYGLNENAIHTLASQGINLVITVDTGISAVNEVKLAKEMGLKIIVTDHHECQEELPPADAVIDPKRPEDQYPFKLIAGVGVAFKLACALTKSFPDKVDPFRYLELVAIGTVSDLMPLIDENRIIVKEALAMMKHSHNYGLKALLEVADILPEKMSSGMIGFRIGPRLNAAGRMGDATRGVRLFTSDDFDSASKLAEELNQENINRQEMERQIVEQALSSLSQKKEIDKVIVVAGKGWHHGVIGIVASRILERFYRPVIVLAMEEDKAVGSARSIEGFNLFEALQSCQDLFTKFGGHEMAAGMTLPVDKIDEFRQRINAYADTKLTPELLTPSEKVDFLVDISEITIPLIHQLEKLAPYGLGNPEPKFLVHSQLSEIRQMGKENNHLKLVLSDTKNQMEAVSFFEGDEANRLYYDFPIEVTGNLQINEWNGVQKPQMMVSYFSQEQIIQEFVYNLRKQLVSGEKFKWEYSVPGREVFKRVYLQLRHLSKEKPQKVISWRNLLSSFEGKNKDQLASIVVALAIFEELKLCTPEWTDQGLSFQLIEGLKVDLEQSKVYQNLH